MAGISKEDVLTYLENANINHDCRYASLSLPIYKFGNSYTGETDNIHIYLDNKENANINQVAFEFSVEDIEKLKLLLSLLKKYTE